MPIQYAVKEMEHQDYTVGWICALPAELAAAVAMLDEHHDQLSQDSCDTNDYILGRIGRHNVAIACLPAGLPGITSAAIVASYLSFTFPSIRFGLMVGIGGGAPSKENDIRLGDVVVSQPAETFGGVIQYDFGKTVHGGQFKRTGSLNRPPDVLLTAVSSIQARHFMKDTEIPRHLSQMLARYPKMQEKSAYQGAEHDQLYEAEYVHRTGQLTCVHCDNERLITRSDREDETPTVHYGLIASGNQVMRDGVTRDSLRKELDVLCFEMEAAGLMDNFPCLIIRGICNYADTHKSERWRHYAAATAAAYTKELLYIIPGPLVAHAQGAIAISTKMGE